MIVCNVLSTARCSNLKTGFSLRNLAHTSGEPENTVNGGCAAHKDQGAAKQRQKYRTNT
jgi:hypothetical protein